MTPEPQISLELEPISAPPQLRDKCADTRDAQRYERPTVSPGHTEGSYRTGDTDFHGARRSVETENPVTFVR